MTTRPGQQDGSRKDRIDGGKYEMSQATTTPSPDQHEPPAPRLPANLNSARTLGEYFYNWSVRVRAGDTGVLPVVE